MAQDDFTSMSEQRLVKAALDVSLGNYRAKAIAELTERALVKTELLLIACKAISSDRRVGIHHLPLGWFGADKIFLSGRDDAMRALLREMDSWEPAEQEHLVRHWAGAGKLNVLTQKLGETYGWLPRYGKPNEV